jgi:hypothetical protein
LILIDNVDENDSEVKKCSKACLSAIHETDKNKPTE